MVKDYASLAKAPSSKRKRGHSFYFVIAILAILAVAGFYLKNKSGPGPQTLKKITEIKPRLLPVKPKLSAKTEPKPQFDFYTLLSNMEVKVPNTKKPPVSSAPASTSNSYILQIASFRGLEAATQFKQSLQTLDVSSFVQKYRKSGKTFFRIITGPYAAINTAVKTQTFLKRKHISSLLVTLKPVKKKIK